MWVVLGQEGEPNTSTVLFPRSLTLDNQNERIMPIIICLVPTMVGSAMLIGLNDSGHKGALLVGAFSHVYFMNVTNV